MKGRHGGFAKPVWLGGTQPAQAAGQSTRMIKNHLENILTHLRHPIANAVPDGLNSTSQIIKSNARGFRNLVLF